jgi:hypothetical protein
MPVVTGGSQTITSQNGNYQIHTSVLKPDGQVIHTHQTGSTEKVVTTTEKPVKTSTTEKSEKKD